MRKSTRSSPAPSRAASAPDERILVHTTGLVSQDVAICHYIFEQAKAKGLGITLPAARAVDEP